MSENISIREWIKQFDAGAFAAGDFDTQCKAGWYDWFCDQKRLAVKTRILAPKVKKISRSPKIDIDTHYVWFKNNCPMVGQLYDDIRIANMETGKTLFCITPRSGHTCNNNRTEIWGSANEFQEPLLYGTWADVLKYLEVPRLV